jgi:hypothetical protein
MTGIFWELLVAGLLLYGIAILGIATVIGRGGGRGPEIPEPGIPDEPDAPIFVTRRSRRGPSATVTSRTGTLVRL